MKEIGYQLEIPDCPADLDQHEEWFMVHRGDSSEKIRIQEYEKVYKIPGLYEDLVYDRLKCESHLVVTRMLAEQVEGTGELSEPRRVLEVGAGNGIVAEAIKKQFDCEAIHGVDIIPEAAEAAERDRPGLYDDYHVVDLTKLDEDLEAELSEARFNTMVTVSAMGFGHLPVPAFLSAFNLIQEGGFVAFNVLAENWDSGKKGGYKKLIERLEGGSLELLAKDRYCHRFNTSGQPLTYIALIARKLGDAEPRR